MLGASSVHTLPANRSLVFADSLYRDVTDPNQGPYDFLCNLSGSAIEGKEIIYRRLHWNQPLFSHNNTSCELLFQINGDETTTYVVYATPFLCFSEFDGNPAGTSFLTPRPYSYASNMELGLQNDVRNYATNLIPIVGGLQDANGFAMTPQFRYSSTKGFVFTFEPSINPAIPVYTLRLLPCSYIEKAHFVHGFGILSPSAPTEYTPRDLWTVGYFSDDTPSLLPTRYIVITSDELTRDKRMISFQNANSSKIINELAIFTVNRDKTGAYHSEVTGEDGTVLSKRADYNPQSFRITISDEKGNKLRCDDIINAVLSSPDVYSATKFSFLYGPLANRGTSAFTNVLLSGLSRLNYSIPHFAEFTLSDAAVATGMNGLQRESSPHALDTSGGISNSNNSTSNKKYSFAFIVLNTSVPTQLGNRLGLDQTIGYGPFSHTNLTSPPVDIPSQTMNESEFMFTPSVNTKPGVAFDLTLTQTTNFLGYHALFNYFFVGIWSYTSSPNRFIYAASFPQASYKYIVSAGPAGTFTFSSGDTPLLLTPTGAIPTTPHKVIFVIQAYYSQGGVDGGNNGVALSLVPGSKFRFYNLSNTPSPENPGGYVSPFLSQGEGYSFGNPQANGLCEELIHEIQVVSEFN